MAVFGVILRDLAALGVAYQSSLTWCNPQLQNGGAMSEIAKKANLSNSSADGKHCRHSFSFDVSFLIQSFFFRTQ